MVGNHVRARPLVAASECDESIGRVAGVVVEVSANAPDAKAGRIAPFPAKKCAIFREFDASGAERRKSACHDHEEKADDEKDGGDAHAALVDRLAARLHLHR